MTVPFEPPRPSALLPPVACVDLARDQLRLSGSDAASFLHNFCTNDVKRLRPGEGCEAFLTNVKGRILGHVFIFAGESSLDLEATPGTGDAIRTHLDRYIITEDVQIEMPLAGQAVIYLFGANSPSALNQTTGLDIAGLKSGDHRHASIGPHAVIVRRVDFVRATGFEIVANASVREDIRAALIAQGAESITREDFEAFRIDAGFPMHGVDISEDNLAQEANRTERAINFRKGCYLGQEPIARLDALGHVNRLLQVIAFDDTSAPGRGDKIVDPATKAELGTLSSVGRLKNSAVVGMAILKTSVSPGSRVAAISVAGESHGTVVPIDPDHPTAA